MLNNLQRPLQRPQNERIKKWEKKGEERIKEIIIIMEDTGDNRARRRGKHNLNFEDHLVFFYLSS